MLRVILIAVCLGLTGCSSIFFFPMKWQAQTPSRIGLEYRDVYLRTTENLIIHGWFLPVKGEIKGTVYYLHGNAENISTHIQSVQWLPAQGYQVFLLDYREFGLSEGKANVPGALDDITAGLDWLLEQETVSDKPIFLLGQSLGASLVIYFAATDEPAQRHLSGVVSDAAFTRYSDVVRYVASKSWLTWLFQYPASWLVTHEYDPVDYVGDVSPVPLMLIHSTDDTLIPFEYSALLFDASGEPKTRVESKGRHVMTFNFPENRTKLLYFFERYSAD